MHLPGLPAALSESTPAWPPSAPQHPARETGVADSVSESDSDVSRAVSVNDRNGCPRLPGPTRERPSHSRGLGAAAVTVTVARAWATFTPSHPGPSPEHPDHVAARVRVSPGCQCTSVAVSPAAVPAQIPDFESAGRPAVPAP